MNERQMQKYVSDCEMGECYVWMIKWMLIGFAVYSMIHVIIESFVRVPSP